MILEFQGEYRFLSNFYPSVVSLDGMKFSTVEHAYQAAKTANLDDRLFISMLDTPGQAKRAGRKVTLRRDWERIKEQVMLDLLRQKFAREPLRGKLLATGHVTIQEGNNWGDRYWGISPVGSGQGKNRLGILLEEVRRELR